MGIVYHHGPRKISDSSMASQCRPQQHDVTDDEPGPLDQSQTSRYRSQVARCLFFSQDRADNIHRERVVPKNVIHQTAEPLNIEEVGHVLEA